MAREEVTIKKFDNGIGLYWKSVDGGFDPMNLVVKDGEEAEFIGNIIWDSIFELFDKKHCEIVEIKLELKEGLI